jgi:hypothetical protein
MVAKAKALLLEINLLKVSLLAPTIQKIVISSPKKSKNRKIL